MTVYYVVVESQMWHSLSSINEFVQQRAIFPLRNLNGSIHLAPGETNIFGGRHVNIYQNPQMVHLSVKSVLMDGPTVKCSLTNVNKWVPQFLQQVYSKVSETNLSHFTSKAAMAFFFKVGDKELYLQTKQRFHQKSSVKNFSNTVDTDITYTTFWKSWNVQGK